MSVYKQPEKSRFWQYDFRFKGRRFHGSTGCEGKRAAEAVVRKLRQDAALGLLSDGSQLTIDQAAGKWWAEVGKALKDGQRGPRGASVLEVRLDNLIQLFGSATRLAEIRQPQVAAAIERRRGQGYTRSPKKGAKVYYPANATVNRDVINTLREILGRAATHWGAEGLPKIDWGALRLEEPRPSARLYAPDQVERWMDEATRTGWYKGKTARPDAADLSLALDLILTYGLRVKELFFAPEAYEAADRRLVWMKGRKRHVLHTVPLREHHARKVAALVGRAQAAGLDHIWFYQDGNALIPISPAGLTERLNNAANRAGVKPGRLLHGGRHHAGTTFQRKHGDRKLTQRLLGHLDAKSTDIYVHLDDGDLRQALESPAAPKSRNSPGPRAAKLRKRKHAMGL